MPPRLPVRGFVRIAGLWIGRLGSLPRIRSARHSAAALLLAALASGLGAGCSGSTEDRIAEIRARQDIGQFNESIEPLRELLAREPDLAEANYLLGVALVQTGQPSLAVWSLEKALASDEYQVQAGLLLASTFLNLEAYGDAIRVADHVLAADPNRSAALRVRAHALLGMNRREEAVVDAQRLYEAAPADFQAGLLYGTILAELGRTEEADKIHAEMEAAAVESGDPGLATRACLARAAFFEDNLKDDARAEAQYRSCLEKAPTDPFALRLVTGFLEERGRKNEVTVLWQRAVEKEPENLALRQALAGRYEAAGKADAARALLTEAIELVGSAQAWAALAEFERRTGHPKQALEALEQAEKAAPQESEQLLFMKADLLVDTGQIEAAEKLIDTFTEPSFRDLLKGRVLLAKNEPRAALDAFEAGLRRWPNNAGGRYLAALAARDIGDFDRAISELRDSVRADAAATDAALLLATLEAARGNHKDAVEAATLYVEQRGGSRPDGYRVGIRSLIAQGQFDNARKAVKQMRDAGFALEATLLEAELESAAAGPARAVAVLRASGLDPNAPANEAVLRALADGLLSGGHADEALQAVDRALAKDPERATLHELRGVVLLRLARQDDAQAAFEKALALDADNARALTGLAELAFGRGDAAKALELYDEAARANPADIAPVYAAAQLALATNDRASAEQRLEEVIRRDPGHAAARNDLAWLLAQSGENLDRALSLAQLAYQMDASPDIADTLGWVHLQRGENQAASELFETALAARPDAASIRYHLGLALARQGEEQRALEALRKALEAGPFPEADAARSELARLERQ